LHIPKGSTPLVMAGLEAVPETRRAAWRVHRVGQGETLASIAKQYNTPVSSITSANTSSNAGIGDVLVIPAALQESKVRLAATKRTSSARSKVAGKTQVKRTTSSAHRTAAKPSQRRAMTGTSQRASLR
jgi:LysM repeat protein